MSTPCSARPTAPARKRCSRRPEPASPVATPVRSAILAPSDQLRGFHAVSRSILRPAAHRAERRAGDVGARPGVVAAQPARPRSEEHTSELQSLMRISYAVFCLKKKKTLKKHTP